jgi:peptidoglycan/LPS O-acetylase OafA/YrhL
MRGSPATRERGYMPQLDALRFFAVMGVLLVHNWQPSPGTPIVGQVDWADLGVRLFFVLSGFLITGILISGRDLADGAARSAFSFVRRFYIRRVLRIFPVYYLVIVVLALAAVGGIRQISPWLFTYTTNIYIWHHLAFPYAVPHFWTLAVEEQFYVVWPWVMLFLPRRWLVPFLLGLCCVGPAWRLYASFHYARRDWDAAYTFTFGVIDFLALGALLALLAHERPRESVQRALSLVVLPAGALVYVSLFCISRWGGEHHAASALEDTGAALVFCWLIGTASHGFTGYVGRLLEWRPIVYLGKISYGIYIYHLLVPLAFERIAAHWGRTYENSGFVNFVVTSLVTFVVAAISWHAFERPVNGLKRHFRYTKPDLVPADAVAAST